MGKVDIHCNLCGEQIYEDKIYDDQYSWAVSDQINEVAQTMNDHYRVRHKFRELMAIADDD
jgi:uncharacterized protein YifN (PemK superfamily)